MNSKVITIQPIETTQQRSFDCQLVVICNVRTYVLDNTEQDQTDNLSDLVPGCKVFDDGVLYRIKEIWYSPDSKYLFLNVYRDLSV